MTRRRRAATSPDPVSAYAEAVLSGDVVAGPHVRAAAKRHLTDLKEGPARGLRWDLPAALRAINFFPDVLRLNGGQWEGKSYALLPWQAFIVGSVFGWKNANGFRRFRVSYTEAGKGCGKSPLAAGLGLYGLTSDGESRAEVYSAATKKDQAAILFRDAVAMVDQSPELGEILTKSGIGENTWNLAYRKAASWFRPISSDDGQSGPRPHISLLDEIHEHRTSYMVETLRAGMKWRRQPLMFMITNSGSDRNSVCWGYHDYAIKVANGDLKDDAFFGYVCALDEGDDPMTDESCWPKANPSLGIDLPGLEYLRGQVLQARGIGSQEAYVRRINFCQWTEADNPWLARELWEACADPGFDKALLRGRRCWAGLDLSSTTDLTALVLLFEPTDDDPLWRLVPFFWLPGDGLVERAERERGHLPFLLNWTKARHIETFPGGAIDKFAVARRCAEITSAYELKALAYDRWRIEDFKKICEDEGLSLPLIPFGQGFKDMAPAVDEFERLIFNKQLRHDGNPVMNYCCGSAIVVTDPAGNRKITKEKSTGRVDGMVAAVMGIGSKSMAAEEAEASMVVI